MEYKKVIDNHLATLEQSKEELISFCENVVKICIELHCNKNHLYVCGNGGSAADATHIVGELVGRLRKDRTPYRATCLGADFATMTAISNDYGYEKIFAREVEAKMLPGDVLWCISTSGNSANIIAAAEEAQNIQNTKIIGMTGESGGKLKAFCTQCLCVKNTFSDRIQEIHQLAYHMICQGIEEFLLEAHAVL